MSYDAFNLANIDKGEKGQKWLTKAKGTFPFYVNKIIRSLTPSTHLSEYVSNDVPLFRHCRNIVQT